MRSSAGRARRWRDPAHHRLEELKAVASFDKGVVLGVTAARSGYLFGNELYRFVQRTLQEALAPLYELFGEAVGDGRRDLWIVMLSGDLDDVGVGVDLD